MLQGAFFQPYIPLQQIDVLMNPITKSFMVGTSNSIFTHHKACHIDVVVNVSMSEDSPFTICLWVKMFLKVDNGTLEVADSALNSALSLTPADKRFIDGKNPLFLGAYFILLAFLVEITKSVVSTWSQEGIRQMKKNNFTVNSLLTSQFQPILPLTSKLNLRAATRISEQNLNHILSLC
jgi:hypothetical protein